MGNLFKKLSPAMIYAIIRWVATVLGSTAIGAWLSANLTQETVTVIFNNLSAIIGGIVALIAIVQSLISKSKKPEETVVTKEEPK